MSNVKSSESRRDQGCRYLARAPRRPPTSFSNQRFTRAWNREGDFTEVNTSRSRRNSAPKATYRFLAKDADSSSGQNHSFNDYHMSGRFFQWQKPTRSSLQHPTDQEHGVARRYHLFRGRSLQNMHFGISNFLQNEHKFSRPGSRLQDSHAGCSQSQVADLQGIKRAPMPSTEHKSKEEPFLSLPSKPQSDNEVDECPSSLAQSPARLNHRSKEDINKPSQASLEVFEYPQIPTSNGRCSQKMDYQKGKNYEPSLRHSLSPKSPDASFSRGVDSITPDNIHETLRKCTSPLERLEEAIQNAMRKRWHNRVSPDEHIHGLTSGPSMNSQRCSSEEGEVACPLSYPFTPKKPAIASHNSETRRATFTIFDDQVASSIQPQTPADIHGRGGWRVPLATSAGRKDVHASGSDILSPASLWQFEQEVPVESRSSSTDLPGLPRLTPTPVSRGEDVATGIASSAHRRITSSLPLLRGSDRSDPEKENSVEAEDLDAIHEERWAWHQRGETSRDGVMNNTPPRVGRFERWIHQ